MANKISIINQRDSFGCLFFYYKTTNERLVIVSRKPDERIEEAKELFLKGVRLVEIANQLDLPEGTIRSWKNRYKWDCNVANDKRNVANKKKKGGQPNNKNATGPPKNKNAEKHGFFSKYLPEETYSIIQEIRQKDPLDILWENIQISYAAIVRAQQIMYVEDKFDKSTTKIGETDGKQSTSKKWEVQYAWDKQANFLKAQARAQGELRSLIKQYDELLHKNWELATEEQRARIAVLKAQVEPDTDLEETDDGFIEALNATAGDDWINEEKDKTNIPI